MRFERTLNGVVFYTKISAGNHCAFASRSPQIFIKFDFFDTRFGGHGLKDCFRVTEHPAVSLKVKHSALFFLV